MPLQYLVGGKHWGDSPEGKVVQHAHRMLDIAHVGLTDLAADDPYRRVHGACSVAVFGRSVTFVLQNLRSTHRDTFDDWYAPRETEMRTDGLMRYFHRLRSSILKEGAPEFIYRSFYRVADETDGFATAIAPSYFGFDIPHPISHLGQPIEMTTSLAELGRMYLDYLWVLIVEAAAEFLPEPTEDLEATSEP